MQPKLVSVDKMIRYRQLQLKKRFISVYFITLLLCFFTSAIAGQLPDRFPPGLTAPDFELQDMLGEKHQLKSYAGKTVIVNFWAVWCAPCRKEIPSMNRALAKLKDENIAMLGVNVGDQQEMIEDFSKDYPMDFTVLMDKDAVVSQSWQVSGFPTTCIVNPDGEIVYRFVGDREWDEKSMLSSVRSISAN